MNLASEERAEMQDHSETQVSARSFQSADTRMLRRFKRLGPSASCAALAVLGLGAPALAEAPKLYDAEFGVDVHYDSNVAHSSPAQAALRGVRLNDVIVSPTIHLDLNHALSRQVLFLRGTLSYDGYIHNTHLSDTHSDLTGGVNTVFGPCTGIVDTALIRRESDLEGLALTTAKNTETLVTTGFTQTCARRVGLGPTIDFRQSWAHNSASLMRTSDYRSSVVTAGLAYQRPSFGVLSVFGQYSSTTYQNRFVPTGLGQREDGQTVAAGGVRYVRRLGAKIEGSVSLSYSSLSGRTPGTRGFSGATYALDVSYRVNGRLRLHSNFERALQPSNALNASYTIDRTIEVNADYALGSRKMLSAGISHSDITSRGAAVQSALDLTNEHLTDYYSTLRIPLGRRIYVAFDVREEDRRANLSAFNYWSTRAGLSVGATF